MKELVVLSLFDGMSCGQIALNKLGFKNYKYYASEIENPAMKVTQHNYPNTIQIGDVTKVSYKDGILSTENGNFEVGQIDLIIGGSPCQNLSFAGNGKGLSTKQGVEIKDLETYLELKGQGFEFEGQSYLFWEFIRLREEIKPTFYFLENVKMNKKWRGLFDTITGNVSISVNSSLVSVATRPRLYWTNIEGFVEPTDKGLTIENSLNLSFSKDYPNWLNLKFGENKRIDLVKDYRGKAECLSASMWKGQTRSFCKNENNEVYKYTPEDCELFQNVPLGYTSQVSKTNRFKMLGNGWTVDVIVEFFKPLTNVYKL